jgi:hypothetical protein
VADVLRPPGRGRGLEHPPCPQRAGLNQGYDLKPPRQQMCILCGRVTARRDGDDMPWCGGTETAGT